MSTLRLLPHWTLRGYQRMISRYTPPMCRFSPTCSQYAVVALRTHGIFRGSAMAVWRILRCNPFVPGGLDPVPQACGHGPGGSDRGVQ